MYCLDRKNNVCKWTLYKKLDSEELLINRRVRERESLRCISMQTIATFKRRNNRFVRTRMCNTSSVVLAVRAAAPVVVRPRSVRSAARSAVPPRSASGAAPVQSRRRPHGAVRHRSARGAARARSARRVDAKDFYGRS